MGKPPVYPKSESQNFLKKLYAFTNIKQLLNKIKVTSDEAEQAALEERAVSLALENNLVTDLTSLVVVKPDAEPVINQLTTDNARRTWSLIWWAGRNRSLIWWARRNWSIVWWAGRNW